MSMSKKQYADYEAAVANFFEAEGIRNLSADGEPYFSHRSCDCCGTHLGGDRYAATGYNPETEEVLEYEVCQDCVYYAEYGQLDDQSMLDIEDSAD